MNAEIKQFNSGLSITTIIDEFGRETEIWRGYKEVIIVNKNLGRQSDSMRRYTIEEFQELAFVFEQVIKSRPIDPVI